MARWAICLLLLTGLALAAPGGEMVQYKAGDETVSGYLALPTGKGPFPAVILIHEWWGLNDWAREQADACARRGYAALAVDLYRGKATSDRDLAHELSRGLPADRALSDLEAALAYLKGRKDVSNDRIGCIGWCMGGGYALELALHKPLQATVVAYGQVKTRADGVKSLQGPVLGIFGENDRGIPLETVKAFERALSEAGKPHKIVVFPRVGHAFMNPNNQAGYDKTQARAAWTAIWSFFESNLRR
ncbi:dienelactone hydrolase family protein [bacterium CPR1]|nr:dienelactone hydrolase family protein [bacterium CPR1]